MHHIHIQRMPLQLIQYQPKKSEAPQKTFLHHLEEAKGNLKISKHARERIEERNIQISQEEWKMVTDKVLEARLKGVNQPLVLMDQAALVVSAKNETVITAMDIGEAKQQLFTNIDGTIVL